MNSDNFPFKEELVVLDIGPAPSLYALSDIFYLLKNYYKEKIKIKEMNLGYVEQSRGFQNFLHHFPFNFLYIEYAPLKSNFGLFLVDLLNLKR